MFQKKTEPQAFLGIFIIVVWDLWKKFLDGARGWVEDSDKSEAGKLLRSAVLELPLKMAAAEGERGAPNPPSFFPHFLPNATGTAATESPTKLC